MSIRILKNLSGRSLIAWMFDARRWLLPDDSVMGAVYCRAIQPLIRRQVDIVTPFFQEKDYAHWIQHGPQTIRSRSTPNEVRKILVIKLDHIGDFVLGFPAYKLLKESFPDAEVTLLCGSWNADLAKTSGLFDHVASLNIMPEISGECTKKIDFDQAALDHLNLPDFDIAIDFRDSSETRFLLDKVCAKFRAGFYASDVVSHMDLGFPSTSFRLNTGRPTHHQTLQTLLVGAVVAAHKDDARMRATLETVASRVSSVDLMRVGKGPIIGINTGSGMKEKNWPLDRFIMLGLHLIKGQDATLVLFGSGAQESESNALAEALQARNVLNFTGKLSLGHAISTMRKLDAYIGNDTGTTHIAAALDMPTVCLFSGATTHDSHGARGANCISILANKRKGMASISVSHVMRALSTITAATPTAGVLAGETNLIVINNKLYASDFRKYLIRAADRSCTNAVHLGCRAEMTVTFQESIIEKYASHTPASVITEDMLHLLGQKKTLILVGLGLSADHVALVHQLQMSFASTKVLYDVFDYYRYGAEARLLARRQKLDRLWQQASDHTLVLEEGLVEMYPDALHFNNASHLERLPTSATAPSNRLVYIGSIDRRVDFEWLEALAGHAVTLDIYGQIHESEHGMARRLENYIRRHKNVVFHGGYDNDDLPAILGQYRVGIIPYKTNDMMTDHINPDKAYHYLNAGLEVIATPIPQLCRMEPYMHLTRHASEIAAALEAIRVSPRNASWPIEKYTWEARWRQLHQNFYGELQPGQTAFAS